MNIPAGYVLVPVDTYQRFLKKIEWEDIETPTIKDISQYVGVSTEKIKKDQIKIDCPLRVFEKGKQGRGKQTTYFKASVENYKQWVQK